MSDIGNIKGLPDLVPGLTVIRGDTILCASHLAELTYGISQVLNKNIVAIDGAQNHLSAAKFAMARAYMQATGSPLTFPVDDSDIEDAWYNMVHVYGASKLMHISNTDFTGVDVVIRIPDTVQESVQISKNLKTIHKMYADNDICGILCLPFTALMSTVAQEFPIIDFHNEEYRITVALPDGTKRDINIAYTNGEICNKEN